MGSTAQAASVSLSGTQLQVTAGAGEALDLAARPIDGNSFEVDLAGATGWTAPAGCTTDDSAVVCPTSAIASLKVVGSGGGDRVVLRGAVVLEADGAGGDDVLRGGDAADHLVGGPGSDELAGRGGDDAIDGGDGTDTLLGAEGTDQLSGGSGEDVLDGGDGNDTLAGGDDTDSLTGAGGDDQLDGGRSADQLDGGDGNDTVGGAEGNDVAFGSAGNDQIDGGDGNDQLDAGIGDDTVLGGAGTDILNGGGGEDAISGNAGTDQLDGGDGNDSLTGGDGNDSLLGADGNDTLDGQLGDDALTGGNGGDVVRGGDGNDTLTGELDGDSLSGGDGADTLTLALAVTPLTIDLGAGSASGDGPGLDRIIDAPETVIGGSEADVLRGAPFASTTLLGGAGDDRLVGGAFADVLDGGDGRDTVDYSARQVGVTIHADDLPDSGGPGEGDTVASSVEVLIGGDGADDLVGAPGPSELSGGPGDDRIEDLLDGEVDRLHCGAGADTAVADRSDVVDADCERWSNGAALVRSIDPISAAVRSQHLAIDSGGRMRVSLVCGAEAVGTCRALLSVQLLHGGKWRPGPKRSLLLTPGRRRNVTVFAQRGFRDLVARAGRRSKARVQLEVRDAIGRTSRAEQIVSLSLPAATGAKR